MSTEAEVLLGQLVEKIEGLETKILEISQENKNLTEVIKLNDKEYRKIYKKIYEQSYKNYKENKILKEALRKADSQSEKDAERETTGIRKETSRKDI